MDKISDVINWRYVKNFTLFMLMGSGANFVLPTALAQEIPYFEEHLPEGLCIATLMNASTACGSLFTFTYLYLKSIGYDIPFNISVPTLLIGSCLVSFLSAAVYDITVDGTSLFLFICCGLSGAIGSVSAVIMNPFMSNFESDYISAGRVGSSAAQVLCALLAVVQQPGSANITFSTSVYMTIFGVYFVLPIIAYAYITKYRVGEKDQQSPREGPVPAGDECVGGVEIPTLGRAAKGSDPVVSNPLIQKDASSSAVEDQVQAADDAADTGRGLRNTNKTTSWVSKAFHDCFVSGFLCKYVVPRAWLVRYPWLANALPYMMTIAWINFNTWGMLSAVYPYAVQYSTVSRSGAEVSQSSAENLSIAFQVAAVCLVAGDFSTTKLRLPFDACIAVFSFLVFVIYLAASDLVPGLFHTATAAPLIIAIFCFGRFLEAHMVTTTYRVAGLYPLDEREEVSQAIGTADQLFTVIGAIFSTVLVSQITKC